eukprot:scaffold40972_cov161-Skeletonema_marinoi.AAC.3
MLWPAEWRQRDKSSAARPPNLSATHIASGGKRGGPKSVRHFSPHRESDVLFPPERIVQAGFRSKVDLFRRDMFFQSLSYRYTSHICLISSGRVPAEMLKILPLTSAEEPGSLGCGQHDRACSPQRPVQKAKGNWARQYWLQTLSNIK